MKKYELPVSISINCIIFHRTGTNTQDSGVKLIAPDAQADDEFGISVAINGDCAIVGADQLDGGISGSVDMAGAAYIFK